MRIIVLLQIQFPMYHNLFRYKAVCMLECHLIYKQKHCFICCIRKQINLYMQWQNPPLLLNVIK